MRHRFGKALFYATFSYVHEHSHRKVSQKLQQSIADPFDEFKDSSEAATSLPKIDDRFKCHTAFL